MGNKTYTSGEINIDPGLTKEHADKIEAKMKDAFGAWPQWKIVKPEWDHAHLAVIGEGDWAKLPDWQEQIQLLCKYFRELEYHLTGFVYWEDEIESGTLHVDSEQTNMVLNTMYVKATCEPDWTCADHKQYPKIDQSGIIVENS